MNKKGKIDKQEIMDLAEKHVGLKGLIQLKMLSGGRDPEADKKLNKQIIDLYYELKDKDGA